MRLLTFHDFNGVHKGRNVSLEQIVTRIGRLWAHVLFQVVKARFEVLKSKLYQKCLFNNAGKCENAKHPSVASSRALFKFLISLNPLTDIVIFEFPWVINNAIF